MTTLVSPTAGPSRATGSAGLAPHKLNSVLTHIEEHIAENVSVRHLAAAVQTSPFHFSRMFKLAVGHPPHLYITLKRMERAKSLLATSRMPLAQIATCVGYQTQAHFTGVFRKHVGLTPRNYRLAAVAGSQPGGQATPTPRPVAPAPRQGDPKIAHAA